MKYLAVVLLFAFIGQIAAAPRIPPKYAYREEDSAEDSDEVQDDDDYASEEEEQADFVSFDDILPGEPVGGKIV